VVRGPTFLLVDTQHDDDLVATDADQLLDTSDTTPRKLGKQDHAIDVVVFEELDVGSHIGNLATASSVSAVATAAALDKSYLFYVDHHKGINLRVLLLVEAAVG
jgi:hypothetical protein